MVRPAGFEPTTFGLGNQGRDAVSGCEDSDLRYEGGEACRPACRQEEHELALLVTLWPSLPESVRRAIVALVEATAGRDGDEASDS